MKTVKRGLISVLLICGLAACNTYTLVKAGSSQDLANGASVVPERTWSKAGSGKYQTWTIDGPALHAINIAAGISDGEALAEKRPGQTQKDPVFRDTMTPLEVVELYRDTLLGRKLADFEYSNLTPANVGGKQGFRFDFTYKTASGLDMKGFAKAVIDEEKLFFIAYSGAGMYYFPKHEGDALQVIESLQFTRALFGGVV